MISELRNIIFNIRNKADFEACAMSVFNYQADNNPVYSEFLAGLGRGKRSVTDISQIPFLPVEFFRNREVASGNFDVEMVFESSGTTGSTKSRHLINDLTLYEESFLKTFNIFYGDPSDFLICALLPSYMERENSSLVYMADALIKMSGHDQSGFYKENTGEMIEVIESAKSRKKRILLLGVSFALLDLAENQSPDLSGVIVMETGGMKGRRKEITRSELHGILKEKFKIQSVHSEYGMTELLSQAYSKGDGVFYCPPWMKVILRDPQDPLSTFNDTGRTGGINIFDLANINSCSFIATSDLGRLHEDGGFEVLGRFDNSDIRGCNLMIE